MSSAFQALPMDSSESVNIKSAMAVSEWPMMGYLKGKDTGLTWLTLHLRKLKGMFYFNCMWRPRSLLSFPTESGAWKVPLCRAYFV